MMACGSFKGTCMRSKFHDMMQREVLWGWGGREQIILNYIFYSRFNLENYWVTRGFFVRSESTDILAIIFFYIAYVLDTI